MRIHSGVLPYACDFPGCDKRFRWKSSLKPHVRMHAGGSAGDEGVIGVSGKIDQGGEGVVADEQLHTPASPDLSRLVMPLCNDVSAGDVGNARGVKCDAGAMALSVGKLAYSYWGNTPANLHQSSLNTHTTPSSVSLQGSVDWNAPPVCRRLFEDQHDIAMERGVIRTTDVNSSLASSQDATFGHYSTGSLAEEGKRECGGSGQDVDEESQGLWNGEVPVLDLFKEFCMDGEVLADDIVDNLDGKANRC